MWPAIFARLIIIRQRRRSDRSDQLHVTKQKLPERLFKRVSSEQIVQCVVAIRENGPAVAHHQIVVGAGERENIAGDSLCMGHLANTSDAENKSGRSMGNALTLIPSA